MTVEELERFAKIVESRFGIRVDERIATLDLVIERTLSGADEYLARLERGDSRELRDLIQAITVGETYFFRHAEQFQAFVDVALPDRIEARQATRSLSILSAACSSGEEPYTLAMLLADVGPGPSWKVDLRGVDLNPKAVERALRARYSTWSLRATPSIYQRRWFAPSGTSGRDLVLAAEIRGAVQFHEGNFMAGGELWTPNRWDVIFCRNVMMYFTATKLDAFLRQLVAALAPGGYLFLGHAETLRGKLDELELCHTHSTFYYRRGGSGEVRAARPASMNADWVAEIGAASRRVTALVAPAPSASLAPIPTATATDELAAVRALIADDRFDDALARLDAVSTAAPRNEALLLRAVVLTHKGMLPGAEAACSELLAVEPLHAGCHYLLAMIRETTGDLVGAVFHAGRAVELDPSFAMAHLHLGLLARRAGDRDSATASLARAKSLLATADPSRLALYASGFSRDALIAMCGGSPA